MVDSNEKCVEITAIRMAMNNTSQLSCLDEERKSEKIVKRRSSVFRRQSVLFDRQESGHEILNSGIGFVSGKNKEDAQADAETFNLEKYIEKLKQERKDWLQEYRNRRIQRKNLTKQKAIVEKQRQLLDMNILTDSERAFVKARPNYEYICNNSRKLPDLALRISMLSQLVCKLDKRFMEKMESNISRATKKLIEMSKQN
ncbi:PREDICTED: uncharacterized protein LOC106745533 [Dinoponera quadriceps]|uniref:Uncharacterized protein LOC106745533 n=1 Tax=Dinoponera quadriceps TaxID=609295 RepID=A0A6P3XER8_DINQU|nr:PREDICTED: uncharacterized protein LOC106745533 [Dinoponera quadriceps]